VHPQGLGQPQRSTLATGQTAGVIAAAEAAAEAGDGEAMARLLAALDETERFSTTARLETAHRAAAGPSAWGLAAALAATDSRLRWSTLADSSVMARWAEALIERGEIAVALALLRRDSPWMAGEVLGTLAMRAIGAGSLELAWTLYDAVDPMVKPVRARVRGALGVAAWRLGDDQAQHDLCGAVRDAVRPPMHAAGGGMEIDALAALLQVVTALPPAHAAVAATVQQICRIAAEQMGQEDTRTASIQRAVEACLHAVTRDQGWLLVARELLQGAFFLRDEQLDDELDALRSQLGDRAAD
jgi:hypothetical protein